MQLAARNDIIRGLMKYTAAYLAGGGFLILADVIILPTLGAPMWLVLFFVFAIVLSIPVLLYFHWMSWRDAAENVQNEESGEVWFLDRPIPPVTGRPSIAIMSLVGQSPATKLMGFGLSGEVINILTQEAGIFVISGNSSLLYDSTEIDVRQAALDLGVTYVLTGTLDVQDGTAVIFLTLWNGQSGLEQWTEELRYTQSEIFQYPVDAVAKVGTSLLGQFITWDPAHVDYFPPPDVASWLKFIEAKAAFRIEQPQGYADAARLAKDAVEGAPEFGRARALLAQVLAVTVSQSLSHDKEFDSDVAMEAANAALRHTHDNHEALAQVARSLLHLGQHAKAQQIAKNAEQKIPDSGPVAGILGFCSLSFGRAELAIYDFGRALRLSPKDGEVSSWLVAVGICHIILGNYEEAIAHMRRAVEMSPDTFLFWHLLANTYGLDGQITEGQKALAKVYELLPSFSVEIADRQWRIMFADASSAKLLTDGHANLATPEVVTS